MEIFSTNTLKTMNKNDMYINVYIHIYMKISGNSVSNIMNDVRAKKKKNLPLTKNDKSIFDGDKYIYIFNCRHL